MRRTVIGFASTVSAVVLLFSYRTSLGADNSPVATTSVASGAVAGAAPATAGSSATTSSTASTGPGAAASLPGATTADAPTTAAATRTVTGTAVSTRYGPVQVQLTLSGTTITAATATEYPTGDHRSAQINASAVPVLEEETVSAQSASIDAVSGASYTSEGYVQSLQSALDQVHA